MLRDAIEELISRDDWGDLVEDLWEGSLWICERPDGSIELAVFPDLNWFQKLSLRLGDWIFAYDWRDLSYLAQESYSYDDFLVALSDRLEKFVG